MNLALRARNITAVLIGLFLMAFVALAPASAEDEFTASHLKASHEAITALKVTEMFDSSLLQAAQSLRAELIRKNPDLRELVNATVDENLMKMVGRRADLENEAVTIYARVFTEDELKAITTFYTSPAGKKLLSDGHIAQRELLQAAQIWQRGIARDLAQSVGTQLEKVAGSSVNKVEPAPADSQ